MKLFHWHSDLLKNYSAGDIVVMAEDVEQARHKATLYFGIWLAQARSWLSPTDEDDIAEVEELKAKLEADLTVEPTEQDVLFIKGSE